MSVDNYEADLGLLVNLYFCKQKCHIERKREKWAIAPHVIVSKFQCMIYVILLCIK